MRKTVTRTTTASSALSSSAPPTRELQVKLFRLPAST
jgi:hypothetical protein